MRSNELSAENWKPKKSWNFNCKHGWISSIASWSLLSLAVSINKMCVFVFFVQFDSRHIKREVNNRQKKKNKKNCIIKLTHPRILFLPDQKSVDIYSHCFVTDAHASCCLIGCTHGDSLSQSNRKKCNRCGIALLLLWVHLAPFVRMKKKTK